MAQFDVFKNPGRQREAIPFVVSLQNRRFDRAATRFVAPLVLRRLAGTEPHYLAPHFTVAGLELVLDVFNLATLPASRLGAPVAALDDEESRSKIIRAIDELISQV
jgi:toxin CcdB